MRRELGQLVLLFVFGLPLGVAAAGLGGYSLARRALAPVDRMAERARYITAERLSDRLPVDNPNDELGRLASVFNDTLGRLESSFEQMRRFTADVSHELRTPLTAIRSVGEVGLRGQRDEHAYRGIIGSMLEEVDRLACLVDRLLAFSRAETGQARLSVESIDLGELADEVAAHLGVLAEEKKQALTVEHLGAPRCLGDRVVLRQALINLVDNAIKYTPVAGQIRIRSRTRRRARCWTSATPVRASLPSRSRGSSTGSTASARPSPARCAERGWGCPSPSGPSRSTEDGSASHRARPAARFGSRCRAAVKPASTMTA